MVPKGADGLIYLPLLPGDPLYNSGSATNFMILSRANFDVDPTTGERIYDNLISSWVDMSVNYGTHAVMTALLKEYDAAGVATGRMLEHFEAPGSALNGGLPNWADIKTNALRIGITLVDQDVLNLPQLKFNADGSLYRNASGMAEVVIEGGQVVRTGHAFLDDMGNGASPSPGLLPDDNTTIGGALQSGRYDDEFLDEHFISGDGRNNENYPLTAVHGIFQAEHNRVFGQLQALIAARGPEYAAQWTGDMLFEATKIVVEAQYQQIVFDEYLARLTPNIDAYASFTDLTLDPTISSEFAHAAFRFGHTQVSETTNFITKSGAIGQPSLLDCFLAPMIFNTEAVGTALFGLGNLAYASSSIAGMARSRSNEIDEFFTDAIRNTLLGLPLDLTAINIARGRDMGMPSLNAMRTELYTQTGLDILKPYTSWSDFGAHLLNPSSLKNFIMAYAGADLRTFYNSVNPVGEADFSVAEWATLRNTDWASIQDQAGAGGRRRAAGQQLHERRQHPLQRHRSVHRRAGRSQGGRRHAGLDLRFHHRGADGRAARQRPLRGSEPAARLGPGRTRCAPPPSPT